MPLRLQKWGGLLTSASPYAIPPGGAAVQINLQNLAPGQLSVRGGMRPMAFDAGMAGAADIRELFRYAYSDGNEKLVVFDATGSIQVLASPQFGLTPEPDVPCSHTSEARPGGGIYPRQGDGCGGTDGVEPPGPSTQVGACCINGVCVPGRTPQQCTEAGGLWMGPNTLCTTSLCAGTGGDGGGGSGTWPCVIWGGSAFTECCDCSVIYGGNAWGCCS
jgi:hypothetical protein